MVYKVLNIREYLFVNAAYLTVASNVLLRFVHEIIDYAEGNGLLCAVWTPVGGCKLTWYSSRCIYIHETVGLLQVLLCWNKAELVTVRWWRVACKWYICLSIMPWTHNLHNVCFNCGREIWYHVMRFCLRCGVVCRLFTLLFRRSCNRDDSMWLFRHLTMHCTECNVWVFHFET